jgi:hypothetical protein
MRRRFGHHSGVVDGGQPAESGRCVFQAVTHIIEAGVVTGQAIDPSELAKPVASLCERKSNMPATASHGTSREDRHGCERHQVTGSVVQHLCREGSRLACTRSLRFGGIQATGRLYQRVEPASVCPRALVAIGTNGDVDYPGPDSCDILRAEAERRDGPLVELVDELEDVCQSLADIEARSRLRCWAAGDVI